MTMTPVDALSTAHPLRVAYEEDWARLDGLLTKAEKRGPKALPDEDLLALPILYRTALSALSVARETSLDRELLGYLEGLCARAYLFVYGVRSTPMARAHAFFRVDWPTSVRSLWREILAAALFLFLGVVAAYLLVSADPGWYSAIVPDGMSNGRDFGASTETLVKTLGDGGNSGALASFATFLFTNNSQTAIFCFALGFAFGLPTAMLLVYNGAILGAMLALFASHGLALPFMGWILIHGTTELLAIVIAGAAGFRIGLALLFPGEMERMAAARAAGRMAATAMIGVVVMLFLASLIEAVGRQTILHAGWRYAIGIGALLFWALYFMRTGRQADGR